MIPGTQEEPPSPEALAAVARRLSAADGALLLADGLRFPAEHFLNELGAHLGMAAARSSPAASPPRPCRWRAPGRGSSSRTASTPPPAWP